MRFQQVVLATQVATPQDMVPCHQQVLDIQRQGQAILRGDRAIPLQPQDILLVGYPLQLATQLGALLLHQVAPLDTPPNPSQVTPRHLGEVIQEMCPHLPSTQEALNKVDIQDKVKEDIKVKLVTPGNQLLLLDIQDKAVTQGNNQVKVVTQGNNQVKAVTQGNSLHQLRLEFQVNSHMLPKGRQDMARHQGVYPQPQQEWGTSRLEGGQWGTFLDQPFVQQTLSTVKRTPRLFAVQ